MHQWPAPSSHVTPAIAPGLVERRPPLEVMAATTAGAGAGRRDLRRLHSGLVRCSMCLRKPGAEKSVRCFVGALNVVSHLPLARLGYCIELPLRYRTSKADPGAASR
jgi:hypothetical protein